MLLQLPASSALFLVLALLADASSYGHTHIAKRHHDLGLRQPQASTPIVRRASLSRRSCQKKESTALSSKTSATSAATSTSAALSSSSGQNSGSSSGQTGSVAAGDLKAVKPADWPTATQSGPKPTSTVASTSDPYLEELSKAIDNSGNAFFTQIHTGDMTYYGQGLGACGDVYDDTSFTAAVSKLMFDAWPGASAEQNRNPICGPFVPGRKVINTAGLFASVSSIETSVAGYAEIGGDGLINCVGSTSPIVQCHVPLTATVTHAGKSIQVRIVDRCENCTVGSIDLTPTAFAALADVTPGRLPVTWKFDNW
ncbi:hypothetical protein B0H16DRAFT_1518600 [Mycena metata]|uniref:RlpA-like protein double-psi beta-barrel domain-containing protein n=1 Tax=Mycena metata TaxID=1033252 RepID=A0AAD7JNZ7_9AGAR|nr:hypothetical protein B0H16DRAFT_1518600 [Mycena metata]